MSSIPTSVARHRSVGAEDQVAVSPEAEPTVADAGAGSPYQVGITNPDDCYEAKAEVSQAEAESASTADGFCGALFYNADGPASLQSVSPHDQHIPDTVGGDIGANPVVTFDVVRTDMVGIPGGLTLCTPFCSPGNEFLIPGSVGNAGHEIFYDTASETGITHDSKTTKEEQRNNRRNYGSAQVAFPNAGQAIQKNTGMWEMNGWTNLNGEYTFVGFLEDGEGKAISNDRLKNIIDASDLPDTARPSICGFTPDLSLSTTKSDNFCETELKYYEPDETEADFKEYGDRCQSPTYVCHEAAGPAWRMSPPPYLLFEHLGPAEDEVWGGNAYREWHWVVAPAAPECPATEPGFSFDAQGTSAPYMGHDLDVYTPITRLDGASTSPQPIKDYGYALTAGPVDTVQNSTELPPEVEQALDDALAAGNAQINETNRQVSALQNATVQDVQKSDRMEPNTVAERNPLADTSQSFANVERSLDTDCQLLGSSETPETVDPWVDIIDSEISTTRPTSVGALGVSVSLPETLYGNHDASQDDDNRPGPARITTGGNVGLFTDKNDDGDYDTTGDPFRAANIQNTGAYGMLWGMRVDTSGDSPTVTTDGSCELGNNNVPLSQDMDKMGYGINTGLFQLVYLQEPTTADTGVATDNRVVYSSGNNIYLLASQSVKALWEGPGEIDPGASDDFPLDNKVDSAIRALQTYADGQNGGLLAPSVQVPGASFGLDSDFGHQCLANTGSFPSKISFTHECQASNCTGDTVLTQYVFELTNPSGQFEDGDFVPSFSGISDQTSDFTFGPGVHAWTDVDPLDGDADRNDDDTERPPTAD